MRTFLAMDVANMPSNMSRREMSDLGRRGFTFQVRGNEAKRAAQDGHQVFAKTRGRWHDVTTGVAAGQL